MQAAISNKLALTSNSGQSNISRLDSSNVAERVAQISHSTIEENHGPTQGGACSPEFIEF